jgi:hypothetical protein
VQGDGCPPKFRELEDVREQVLGEDDAARADERYLDDRAPPVLLGE